MKITVRQLKQLIKEQVEEAAAEDEELEGIINGSFMRNC